MKNTRGFALIEALLIFVIVGALAGVGWYVYQRQNTDDSDDSYTYGTNTPVEPEEEEANTDEVEYLSKTFTSYGSAFSMSVLNGWTLNSDTNGNFLFQYDVAQLTYDKNKEPQVNETDKSGVGGYVPGVKVSVNEFNEEINSGEKFVLNDGTTGYCKEDTFTAADDIAPGMGNFINKSCFFKKNNSKLSATYSYYQDEPLNAEAVEFAFKTIEF